MKRGGGQKKAQKKRKEKVGRQKRNIKHGYLKHN
jgi:hypothetical protein